LRGLHEKNVAIDLLGKDGCTLFGDSCDAEHWAERVRELHPDATLVYLAGAFLHGFGTGGGWQHACHHEWDAKFEHALTRRLRELAAENTRVFALTVPYPVARWDTGGYRAQVDCINRSLRKAATAVPGVRMLEVAEKLCPKGICELETREQRPIRPDGVHFSLDGARSLSRWVFDSIVDAR
jgi:lysophospholipase L1-like esterase